MKPHLQQTIYFEDFLEYYRKAKVLQQLNIESVTGRPVTEQMHVDDPLMHHITIYDCIERRYAGFSNAIQQLWFGSANPKQWQARPEFDGVREKWGEVEWFFVFLMHRVTGSGASFSFDHGFRNSILYDLAQFKTASEMKQFILDEMRRGRAIFTSIGNQIPPFPKPDAEHARGSELYIDKYAPRLVIAMLEHLRHNTGTRPSVEATVNFANAWHVANGLKRFSFVLTAWVMDIAEYFPKYVDPDSHVHYGKNAIESMELMFRPHGFKRRDDAYRAVMETVVEATDDDIVHGDGVRGPNRPYSLEDVLCDYVRYITCYVPKGYEHLEPHQVEHRSLAAHPRRARSWHAHIESWNAKHPHLALPIHHSLHGADR